MISDDFLVFFIIFIFELIDYYLELMISLVYLDLIFFFVLSIP